MTKIKVIITTGIIFFTSISYSAMVSPIYEDESYVVLKSERHLLIMHTWPLSWFAFPISTEILSFRREASKDSDRSGTHLVINDEPVFFSEFKALLYYQSSKRVLIGSRLRNFNLKVFPGCDGMSDSWSIIYEDNEAVVKYCFRSESLKYVFTLHIPRQAEYGGVPDRREKALASR